jgi:NAD(P)-dependent dehydrogenase (short-subunit alcohol dehydrogenase family)
MVRLAGKFALITGGTSGIGLATAKAFVANGARVAITGRDQKTLDAAKEAIDGDHLAFKCDAANLTEIDTLYAAIKERFGALDIIFANAGVADSSPMEEATELDFDRIFNVNVKGVFFTVQKGLPLLRRGASIILNASIAPRMGRAGLSLYSASKAAVRTFARNFSSEFVSRGFRVNVVSPGSIRTPAWNRLIKDPATFEAMMRVVGSDIPQGRLGTPEEIANVVLFLASDESSYMLGAEITVDGGATEMRTTSAFREENPTG